MIFNTGILKRVRNISVWHIVMSLALLMSMPLRAQENDKRRFDYFFLEAVRQQEKGNYGAAFDLLRHAQEINPGAAEVYFLLSGYYVDLKNDSLAGECFKNAARLSPSNSTYEERLGQYYVTQKKFDEAIATYESLYEDNNGRGDVLELLYRLYGMKDDYPKMIEILDRIEVLEGSSEQLTLTKMQIYEQQGERGKAQKELRALVEKHPNDLTYRVMLGNWLLQNDNLDAAFKEYDAVLKEEPGNIAAQMSMLDYYHAKGEKKKADELLCKLLENMGTDSETKLSLMRQVISETEDEGGDSIKVMSLFDKVLSYPQQDAGMLMLKAAYMSLKAMPENRINSVYEKALSVEPDNSRARFLLIRSLWEKNEYDKVIEICKPAQEYNPDEMAFYYFQGLAHYNKGENDDALETFRKGVGQIGKDSDPDIVSDFYAIMGDILHAKGLDDDAFEAYDSCLHWKPDNISALNNYAYYLSLRGKDLSRAEQMSYKTIKAEPENSTYLDTYAWILFMQKRYEEAKIYIDQAIRNDSALSDVVLEHVGDIYYMTGDSEKAVEYWRRAVDEGNDSALLARKIKLRKYISE